MIMSQIINKVADVDPNNSDAVKEVLAAFFRDLDKHTEDDSRTWIRTLETVINRFPKYCMYHRPTIEGYLTHFLTSTKYHIVIGAAKCAHALQQVRPIQEKTATPKSCWREQMSLVCHTLHTLIGDVFEDAIDIYEGNTDLQTETNSTKNSPLAIKLLGLSSISNMTQNKTTTLCNRIRNVLVFLQAMLVEIYPVAKPLRPQIVLDVIIRALSVSNASKGQSLQDLATVKIEALRTLDALIACLGVNLIPYSPLVFRSVMQTLRWSADNPSEEASRVRCCAYRSLGAWLGTLRAHRSARAWPRELVAHVTRDVTPAKHVVQLTMNKPSSKNLSKKAKRQLANSMLAQSSIAAHMPGEKNKITISEEMNDEVAIAALECVEIFLNVCGIFLERHTYEELCECLVRECFLSYEYGAARRLRLLRALEASRRAAPPGAPPPAQYCLQLYHRLVDTRCRETSKFCSEALLNMRLHLHCSPPSLNFALETKNDKQKANNNKKSFSERNRAALENLLGSERMPPTSEEMTENEHNIQQAEEPPNKKPRLEEKPVENLSITIDSDSSVELCEDSTDEEDSGADERETVDDEIAERETQIVIEVDEKEPAVEETIEHDAIKKILSNGSKKAPSIHEALTQIPIITSNEIVDEPKSPLSLEVVYDYPNTGKTKVQVLDKMEDDNLPSTNDTDDIQITCGQMVKCSSDVDNEKKEQVNGINDVAVENTVSESTEKEIVENGVSKGDMLEEPEEMTMEFLDEADEANVVDV